MSTVVAEIVASPYTLYLAPVGTTMPAIDALESSFITPSGAWTKIGTSGAKNYSQGVTVTHNQTIQTFVPSGGTTPRKVWRTDEGFTVSISVADVSPAQYALVLGNLAVTTVAAAPGVAGDKHFETLRGVPVATFAMLVRGVSSVDDTLNAQYEVAGCYQSANPAPKYDKTAPAELALQFDALELTPGVFSTLRVQTAVAT